jgi:5'-deoxynucleotidase YfbR-like HD superfamily hydrolase
MLEQEFGYKPPIPELQQRQYEQALHGVMRWQNGKWEDNIFETDMDHVLRMFVILSDINNSCPSLALDVDIPTTQHMIYIHDAGETDKRVGDLTHGRDDYDSIYPRWKNREHAAFRLLTKAIENPDMRFEARRLYKRCVTKNEDDKEAQLTDLIDKLQGARFGFEHVFNGKYLTGKERQAHMHRTARLLSRPTTTLLNLVSPKTQDEIKYFLISEFDKFAECGYLNEIGNLNSILK